MISQVVRKVKQFRKDQIILKEGAEVANTVCYLYRGSALAEHEDQVIGTIDQGEFFGEMAAILQTPRTATVRAMTDCTVFEFEGLEDANLIELLQADPKINRKLIQALAVRLVELSRRHANEVHALGEVANRLNHAIGGTLFALERLREKFKAKTLDEVYDFLKFSSGIQVGRREDVDDRYFPTTKSYF